MSDETFSVLTFNVCQCSFQFFRRTWVQPAGFLEERFALLTHALQETDATFIHVQELMHRDTNRDLRKELARSIASTHPYVAMVGRTAPFGWHQGSGLAIYSKFPLRDVQFTPFKHASWYEKVFVSKGFLTAKADVPGVGTVRLVNIHTISGWNPDSEDNERIRALQQAQLLDTLAQHSFGLEVLAGDFNGGPVVSRKNYQQMVQAGFCDAFISGGGTGDTWDLRNPFNRAGPHGHCPSQRLDQVFVRGRLRATSAEILFQEPIVEVAHGERVPLSDHYGIQVGFRKV